MERDAGPETIFRLQPFGHDLGVLDPGIALSAEHVRGAAGSVLSDRSDRDPIAVDREAAAQAVGRAAVVRLDATGFGPLTVLIAEHVYGARSVVGTRGRNQQHIVLVREADAEAVARVAAGGLEPLHALPAALSIALEHIDHAGP